MAVKTDARGHAAELIELVKNFEKHADEADLRERVLSLVPVLHALRDLGKTLVPDEANLAGRERILLYLQRYPLTVIDGDELQIISGIADWPRRVRELRVQLGWQILSGFTIKDLAADDDDDAAALQAAIGGVDPKTLRNEQYVLVRDEQDREAAYRWNILNSIRKSRISVRDKLLLYLRKNAGKPVLSEELRTLAGGKADWPRRTRELRTEYGWPVYTRLQGRPELPIGTYILDEDRQSYPHDRKIADSVRAAVLERDNFACTQCGWTRAQAQPDDPRRRLELHHVNPHVKGGANTADNLTTLCNVHHDEIHADKD